jgi:hypothetical protein
MKRQQGMGLVSTLILLGLVVFMAYLVIRIAPIYIDDWAVQKILKDIDQKENIYGASKSDIIASVARRFGVSSIYDIKADQIMQIKAGGNRVQIIVDYQREVPVVANLFIIAKFNHQYDFKK